MTFQSAFHLESRSGGEGGGGGGGGGGVGGKHYLFPKDFKHSLLWQKILVMVQNAVCSC